MLLVALWLGLCMLIKAAQADFQCGPKPHTTTPEMGANGLCQCGRKYNASLACPWMDEWMPSPPAPRS